MKSIELKAVKEKIYVGNTEQEIVLTTYSLLKNIINKPAQNGYSIEEMMQRLKLLGVIEVYKTQFEIPSDKKIEDISEEFIAQNETLEIEDADYNSLSSWVKEMRWNILANFIVDFVNTFKK